MAEKHKILEEKVIQYSWTKQLFVVDRYCAPKRSATERILIDRAVPNTHRFKDACKPFRTYEMESERIKYMCVTM